MKQARTLWTRQRPEVWEELKSSGIYRVKKEYIEEKKRIHHGLLSGTVPMVYEDRQKVSYDPSRL